ncbi:MAG: hypothetical protein ACI8ZX_002057, partial [Planctomycetota bacterium]
SCFPVNVIVFLIVDIINCLNNHTIGVIYTIR